jgi:dipeptidyl-peptidase-4
MNELRFTTYHSTIIIAGAFLALGIGAHSQDRLPSAPGYEAYKAMDQQAREARRAMMQGSPNGFTWTADGNGLLFSKDGKQVKLDLVSGKSGDPGPDDKASPDAGTNRGRRFRGGPGRGRQFASEDSPDGKLRAFYKDRNLWISDATANKNIIQVTTEGSVPSRIKFGTASWVYGEELDQVTAFWWSPDSKQIAFYKFDESKVPDYVTLANQVEVQDTQNLEAYPKAGGINPVADLYIYNLQSKKTIRVDTRDGKLFDNDVVGYYVYDVRWTADSSELLYNRTDRRQKLMEIAAADPASGKSRVVVRESNPDGYTENLPGVTFLKDGKRFLLVSSRSGWKNYYLYDLTGKLLNQVTANTNDAGEIVRLDEQAARLFYMARDGDNAMKTQLHVVGLDGRGDRRLTDPSLMHSINLSPDGKYFVDTAEAHDKAPMVSVIDNSGKTLATLFKPDARQMDAARFPPAELIICKAADGKTDLYGILHKPAGFDPTKKYPLLVSVYGGPTITTVSERYSGPNALTSLGFLTASFDNRGTPGRGREFEQATYKKLGVVDIDDQAACVQYLEKRGYVDTKRVGIYGTSYGGYASAMGLLRHPEVYTAACAQSAVTNWRNYDTVYTERYMSLPQDNASGYDAGAAVTYVQNLKGKLMLYFGTADDNVHPSNSLQLIAALQGARKGFEVQVGPDAGHSALSHDRMLEFFLDAFGMWGSSTQ